MFIKRSIIPKKRLYNFCFQNINLPSINSVNRPQKISKENINSIFPGDLKKNQYLVSYDSLTDYENQIIIKSLPNSETWFFIPIICFLSLSSIMHYFYTPKK
jgi:hypothetical protein